MHLKFKHLLEILKKLRSPDGCPWDRKQTIESMTEKLLEETEEFNEALGKKDYDEMEEELGDILLCLVMISQIAEEEGRFDIGGVMERVAKKVISRHTWVFGADKAETPEEALELWKKNKQKEKKRKKTA